MEGNTREFLGIQEIQKVSYDILKFVTGICKENGFRYYLAYGTLIGAVRHKGYIPWDDDVDIIMPRPDYDRFLEWTQSHGCEMGVYEVFNRSTCEDYFYGITRISDSRYEIVKDDEKNCGMGVFLDVYPYDGLGDDKKSALRKLEAARRYCDIIVDIARTDHSIPASLNWKGKTVFSIKRFIHKFLGTGYYHRRLNSLRNGCSFDASAYVGPLVWYFEQPGKVLFERSWFSTTCSVPFEDGIFLIPSGFDRILSTEYGSYMTPPPVEERIFQHRYRAYKK